MKRIGYILPGIVFILVLNVGITVAEEDVQGSKDHPLITRMLDYYVCYYTLSESGTYDSTVVGGNDVQ